MQFIFWKFGKIWKCLFFKASSTSSALIFHQPVLLIKLIFSWGFSHQKGAEREAMCVFCVCACAHEGEKERYGVRVGGWCTSCKLVYDHVRKCFSKNFFFSAQQNKAFRHHLLSHLICKNILIRAITQNHFTNTLKTIVLGPIHTRHFDA